VLDLPASMEIIVAPRGPPQTKPRALNVALALARGAFTVIYDAEDLPGRRQLRTAAARFAVSGPEVACLQARLSIYDPGRNALTRLFAIEYAALFEVINPGLIALGHPILLGGTSNHFRTQVLQVGRGWDAWNVTEDADLSIRLARAGFRIGDLPLSTWRMPLRPSGSG
jgi:cellulose synthase/poly-beta-1,6-N-acetylglucosamine synthase-like glycosyltransferase